MKIKGMLVVFMCMSVMSFANGGWAASQPPSGTYEIDPSHSKVGFEIAHLVISSVEGRFNQFAGEIVISDKPETSRVNAKIDMASIDTGMKKRDDHLRGADFFDAGKYPDMTFQSKKITKDGSGIHILGDLTIHGVTKEVTLDGKLFGVVKDMSGNDRIAAQASTQINRKDFGLTWNKLIEAGPVVGDEVTISLRIEATRQTSGK